MSTPSVSVTMSVYNGEAFLREALDSILAQTLADWECIIIDDGSTDSSGRLLDDYAARDSRFRVVHRENKGLTKSLNEAISMARGEFIARMDADDVCLPQRFEQQVAFLRQHPDHAAVGCRTYIIGEDGAVERTTAQPLDHETIDRMLIRGMTTIAHPSVMIRRTALSLVGGYGESYRTAQDLDLFLKLAEHGRLANIEEPLIKYRWHAENVSIRNAEQQDKDVTAILQSALSRRNLPPLRRIPPIRLQFRRRLALQCAQAGHRGAAIQLAWGACRLRPHSIGNWLTLVGVAACPWALERMMRWRHQLKQ